MSQLRHSLSETDARPLVMRVRFSRWVMFGVIVAAHIVVLSQFPLPPPALEMSDQVSPLVVAFLDITPQDSPPAHIASPPPSARRSPSTTDPRKSPNTVERDTDQVHIPAPPAIDWAKEAETVRARRAEEDAEASRRSSALSRWRSRVMGSRAKPSGPQFHWDSSRIKPLEATVQGLVVHLNERCAIVLSPLSLVPGCKFGKITARGDLFEHMEDIPHADNSSVPTIP
jgi:hypothetical protein